MNLACLLLHSVSLGVGIIGRAPHRVSGLG